VFKKNGFWWIDFYDQDGRRHRQKASPSYEVAKQKYREVMTRITRGEVNGLREEGLLFREFAVKTSLPLVRARLSALWAEHVSQAVKTWLLPAFGDRSLAKLTVRDVEAWAAERPRQVAPSTFNKNLWVLKNILTLGAEAGICAAEPRAGRGATGAREDANTAAGPVDTRSRRSSSGTC
jgi:hypothetical protein